MEALGPDPQQKGVALYRQRGLRNVNSGECFDVVVEYWPHLGLFGAVRGIHLVFREGN